jgi:hypothetical protein
MTSYVCCFQSKILPAVWSPFPTAQAYNYNYYSNGSLSGGLTGLANALNADLNNSLSESIGKSPNIL